jgi:putative membrane-bound dehydrogenase-like protein
VNTRILLFLLIAACIAQPGFAAGAEGVEDSLDRDYAAELPRIPAVEPADALATFEVHPGFRMELVAAEPLVRDPIAMAWDERGRMFVVEMRGYSEERDAMIGEIRLLEDTDGDGVYDEAHTYVDGLAWPTAVACYDGGVFVGVPPHMLYCKDTTGDNRADLIEAVYTGFHLTNVQGMMNTLLWGFDGWIHGATSSSGADVTRPDEPAFKTVTLRGRDFAFNPRTREFVPESGGAQHGMGYDRWGTKFVCSNSDHLQQILFEDRYVGRNPFFAAPGPRLSIAEDGAAADVYRISPVEPWRLLRTRLRVQGLVPGPIEGGGTAAGYFTSATGVTIYKGDAWPEEFDGNAIIGDVGSNLIHRKTLHAKNIPLDPPSKGEENIPLDPPSKGEEIPLTARRADAGTEFVRSTDIWFRPVQFANGPDGCLYVADMYREVIEHPDSLPPIIKKHLDLNSGNDRGRIYRIVPQGFAQKPPADLGAMSSEDLCALLAHRNAWHAETAARLLYERQDDSVHETLARVAADAPRPDGRMNALSVLKGLGLLRRDSVLHALEDADAHVRAHAIRMAEGFERDPVVAERLVAMAADPDIAVRYQAAFTLGGVTGEDRDRALASLLASDDSAWMRVAVMSSLYQGAAGVFAALMEDADYVQDASHAAVLEQVARLAAATGDRAALERVVTSLEAAPEAAASRQAVRGLLAGLKQGGKGLEARAILAGHAITKDLLASLLARARETAVSAESQPEQRVDAAQTLAFAFYEDAAPVLAGLLTQSEPAEVQLAALRALGTFHEPGVAAIVLEKWSGMSPQLRSQAVETLFSREAWLGTLLDSVEAGAFNPAHLESTRTQMLLSHPVSAIQARATALFEGRFQAREEVYERYKSALDVLAGDAAQGKEVFKENCMQCHKVGSLGFDVGPDLVTVAQGGADKILLNILDPNREVNPQYINYIVETSDWETHTGIIASETAASITLRRANGVEETILRNSIDEIRSDNLSIMPDGLEEAIAPQAMADLIAYLSSLE